MPSYPPRREPAKKEEELTKREEELRHAINRELPTKEIAKSIEKYRKAKLSLLKAKIHAIKEKALEKRLADIDIEKEEKQITLWQNKTDEEIILEFK